jgi:hypothetical protein
MEFDVLLCNYETKSKDLREFRRNLYEIDDLLSSFYMLLNLLNFLSDLRIESSEKENKLIPNHSHRTRNNSFVSIKKFISDNFCPKVASSNIKSLHFKWETSGTIYCTEKVVS